MVARVGERRDGTGLVEAPIALPPAATDRHNLPASLAHDRRAIFNGGANIGRGHDGSLDSPGHHSSAADHHHADDDEEAITRAGVRMPPAGRPVCIVRA